LSRNTKQLKGRNHDGQKRNVDIILKRQTIREYKKEQISGEEMETLIAAALRAPSGRNYAALPCQVHSEYPNAQGNAD
jgi:O-phosphoseryl-tRNA(Cys) synthetase